MATQGQVIPPNTDEEVVSESSLSVHEEADRSHQVATAKKFPRSITAFRNELKAIAIASQPVAMEMMYSLPRAGKQLVGPSIRFAEALVSCWGNARVGVEVVDVDRRDGVVVAEGRFYDCEKNVGFAIRTRRRNVMTKKDDDSYQVTGNAASSIALRNAILRGVPKALWNDIFELAKQTAAGDAASLETIRVEMIKLFTALGVTENRLFAALGIPGIADMGPDEIVAMKAWRKQLQSKDSTIEEIFGYPEDVEIEWLMDAMEWPEAKKRSSKQNFTKDKTGHLTYLRMEASKSGITYSSKAGAKAAPAKESRKTAEKPAKESATAKPAETVTEEVKQDAAATTTEDDKSNW